MHSEVNVMKYCICLTLLQLNVSSDRADCIDVIITSIQTFVKQKSLQVNQMTQRETTTIKLQASCTFTPTTTEYFSETVIPNNKMQMIL